MCEKQQHYCADRWQTWQKYNETWITRGDIHEWKFLNFQVPWGGILQADSMSTRWENDKMQQQENIVM